MMDLLYDFILYRTVRYFWGRGFVAEKFGAVVRVTLDLRTCRHGCPPARRVIYNVFRGIGASRKMPFIEGCSANEDWLRTMINSKHETNNKRIVIILSSELVGYDFFPSLLFFFFVSFFKIASKNPILLQCKHTYR